MIRFPCFPDDEPVVYYCLNEELSLLVELRVIKFVCIE